MPHAVPAFRHVPAAVLLVGLALASAPAWAQATAEQQQACAPDAIKLCSDTIPDVPKTTACMKAHVADLSPRCRSAFNEALGGGGAPNATGAKATAARRLPDTARPHVASRAERREPNTTAPDAATPVRRSPRTAVLRRGEPGLDRAPTGSLAAAPSPDALGGYEASIAQSCREGLIDPFTCRNTFNALNLIR